MITNRSPGWRYGAAILLTAALTATLFFVDTPLETTTIVLCYLLAVLVVATTAGLGPGILTSLASFLAFNFFFLTPRYTFHVANSQDVIHLLSFLAVAIVASSLASRAQHSAEREHRRATELAALYDLSQAISARVDLDHILPAVAETTCRLLQVPLCVVLLYNDAGRLEEAARAGQADTRLKTINEPIRDGARVLGILRVVERTPGGGLSDDDGLLLATLATQVRLALDRVRLVTQTAHTEALLETDRLKSALIASVSHDLRTPLAIMKGATSTMLADGLSWDVDTQRALTQSIDVEVDHLNRIVGNLLDMSRIEAGALSAERDWQDIAEVLGAVLQRLAPRLAGRDIHVDVPADLPLVPLNATLIDQVLTNLLENALKYTPAGSPIEIHARLEEETHESPGITVVIRDHGPGIPADERARIFDKFYRQGDATTQVAGVGLGLAICKGIVEAHGGRIWIETPADGGAAFAFNLPLAPAAPAGNGAILPPEMAERVAQ